MIPDFPHSATVQYFKNHRFKIFLSILMFFFLLSPFFENELLLDLLTTGVVIFAVLGVSDHPRLLIVCAVLGFTSVVLVWTLGFFPGSALVAVLLFVEVVYYLLIIGAILSFVFRARPVTREALAGAVCAYLVFGFLWANIYAGLENLSPGSFSGHVTSSAAESNVPTFRQQVSQFSYFSLVTLSTLGYGDITPLTRGARNLAAMEAIFGQLYLAILVARLVSQQVNFSSQSGR